MYYHISWQIQSINHKILTCPFLQIKIETQGHGSVTLRYSTSDGVKQISLAGPWRSRNCQRIWQSSDERVPDARRVKRRSPIAYKPTLFRLVLTVILCRDVGVCTYRLHTGNDVKCSIIKHRSLSERCTEFWIHVNSFISFHLLLRRSSKLVVSFDSDSYLIRHVFTIHHKPHCDCDIGMARLCMSCLMI